MGELADAVLWHLEFARAGLLVDVTEDTARQVMAAASGPACRDFQEFPTRYGGTFYVRPADLVLVVKSTAESRTANTQMEKALDDREQADRGFSG